MSAPIAITTWQTQRADERSRSALAARLAREEQWQAARHVAAAELVALIARRQLEIDNLRSQLSKGISA